MENKILTVIVPSYNMEAYLPKCLGSLIVDDESLLRMLDVIVVNDGSKDRTSEIAHGFDAKYPGVFRVIDKENGHYGSCINAALPVAKGEYVKVLDADDYVETDKFTNLIIRLGELINEEYAVNRVVSDYRRVDAGGNVISTIKYNYPEDQVFTPDDSLDYDSRYVGLHAVIFRTKKLIENNYRQLEGIPYTDTQWALEPVYYAKETMYVPGVVVNYLVGRNGQTMDPNMFVRSFDKFDYVTRYLIQNSRNFVRRAGRGVERYYFERLKSLCAYVCHCYVIGVDGKRPISSGKDFDVFIKENRKDIWDALDSCISSNVLRFQYIKEWRRKYSTHTLKFLSFFIYIYIAKMYRKFKRCFT